MPVKGIINARIFTAAGDIFSNGCILWNPEGKILYVGEKRDLASDIEVQDAGGAWVVPGFIDAHTHLGIQESAVGDAGNDLCETGGSAVTPGMRAIDGIHFEDEAFNDALHSGVTTVMVLPGSSNVISGCGAIIKTAGKTYGERIVETVAGMKCAMGEMPKNEGKMRGQMPVTRMGTAYLLRRTLFETRNYLMNKEKNHLSEFNLDMEAMVPVLEKKMPLRVHAFRSDDIYTAIRIAREFQVKIIIEHGLEAYKVKELLKEDHIPVLFGTGLNWKYSNETKETTFSHVKELMDAGVEVSMITDHGCTPVQYLPLCAAMLTRAGISWDDALKTITIHPARALGLEGRLGSLEAGKDADISIFAHNPLTIGSGAVRVFIKGVQVW